MASIPEETDCELNMTPMIDVVFLLLIFFMLVSEISKADMAQLSLAYASKADEKPDLTDTNRMITINVKKRTEGGRGLGNVLIQGRMYNEDDELREYIHREAVFAEFETDKTGGSNLRIRIRADRDTTTKSVQRILDACTRNKVYKIEVSCSPSPDSRADPSEFVP